MAASIASVRLELERVQALHGGASFAALAVQTNLSRVLIRLADSLAPADHTVLPSLYREAADLSQSVVRLLGEQSDGPGAEFVTEFASTGGGREGGGGPVGADNGRKAGRGGDEGHGARTIEMDTCDCISPANCREKWE